MWWWKKKVDTVPDISKDHGSWPRAFPDRDNLFHEEKLGLKSLDGTTYPYTGNRPVLWIYPASRCVDFKKTGWSRKARRRLDAGPHRIVTDRSKNIIGMISHPRWKGHPFMKAQKVSRGVEGSLSDVD
jgi:hypothetical protein